jgi:hypothetical protein
MPRGHRARSVVLVLVGALALVDCASKTSSPARDATDVYVMPATSSSASPASPGRGQGSRLSTLPGAVSGDLIENGGFETPTVANGGVGFFDQINGWALSKGPAIEIQNHVAGEPYEGEQFVELDSHASSSITQEVNTAAGDVYELRFAFTARAGTPISDNHLRVLWNDEVAAELFATTINPEWRSYALRVKGRQGTSKLTFEDAGHPDGIGTYLDAVSLRRLSR